MKGTMKTLKILAIIGLVSTLVTVVNFRSQATPIGLTQQDPDFFSDGGLGSMSLSYDPTGAGNNFQALGTTLSYIEPNGNGDDSFGVDIGSYALYSFDLEANITSDGMLNSGTVTITGSLDGGISYEPLLTGDLVTGPDGTAFGSAYLPDDPGGEYFEFKFTVDAANSDPTIVSDFGGDGAMGGIILDAAFTPSDNYFQGWGTAFDNSNGGNPTADTFAMVPEPSSILFVLVGSILFVGGRRCRRSALRV